MKLLLITAGFYEDIAALLRSGACEAMAARGIAWDELSVPGALEIPPAIAITHARRPDAYDGYVALGCVIRGETTHYDYVCAESARGLMELGIREQLAIGNGILTVENKAQAVRRADPAQKNKGADAVAAALSLAGLRQAY